MVTLIYTDSFSPTNIEKKLSVSFRVDKERGKVTIFSLSFLPWRDSLETNGQRLGWRKASAVVLKTGCEHVFLLLKPGKYRKLGQSNGSIFLLKYLHRVQKLALPDLPSFFSENCPTYGHYADRTGLHSPDPHIKAHSGMYPAQGKGTRPEQNPSPGVRATALPFIKALQL